MIVTIVVSIAMTYVTIFMDVESQFEEEENDVGTIKSFGEIPFEKSSNLRGEEGAAMCSVHDENYMKGNDHFFDINGLGSKKHGNCKIAKPDKKWTPYLQRDTPACRPVQDCVPSDLLARTRASWSDLFGSEPHQCEEGRRFVLRNFLSEKECEVLQHHYMTITEDASTDRATVRHTPGFEKVRLYSRRVSDMCDASDHAMYVEIIKRIGRTIQSYFLPRNRKDLWLDTDAIEVFTTLDATNNNKRSNPFLYPANNHCDSCVPTRVWKEDAPKRGKGKVICPLNSTKIACNYGEHPFPQRKITTILYLSDTIALTDEQLKMSGFRTSLGDMSPQEFTRSSSPTCKIHDQNVQDILVQKSVKASMKLTSEQRTFLKDNGPLASVGGGLCFTRQEETEWTKTSFDGKGENPTFAECRRTGGRLSVTDACCDPLVQTRCGDLVAFTAGGENPHAVMPVLDGKRLNIQSWWAPRKEPFTGCGMTAVMRNVEHDRMCRVRKAHQRAAELAYVSDRSGSCMKVKLTRSNRLQSVVSIEQLDNFCVEDALSCVEMCVLRDRCEAVGFVDESYMSDESDACNGKGRCLLYVWENDGGVFTEQSNTVITGDLIAGHYREECIVVRDLQDL